MIFKTMFTWIQWTHSLYFTCFWYHQCKVWNKWLRGIALELDNRTSNPCSVTHCLCKLGKNFNLPNTPFISHYLTENIDIYLTRLYQIYIHRLIDLDTKWQVCVLKNVFHLAPRSWRVILFSNQRNSVLQGEKWLILGLSQEIFKMDLNTLQCQRERKCPQRNQNPTMMGLHQRGTEDNWMTSQYWQLYSLSNKIK